MELLLILMELLSTQIKKHLSKTVPALLLMIIMAAIFLTGCESSESSLVFSSHRNGNLDIYSINTDTLEEINLTNSRYDESKPIVAKNGNEIVFITKDVNRYSIETMSISGGPRNQLTNNSNDLPLFNNVEWSPTSDRLSFVQSITSTAIKSGLYIVEANDSNPMRLTSLKVQTGGNWSKDGSRVVFTVKDTYQQGTYVRNPNGVNEYRLTTTIDSNPMWSPVANKIAYVSETNSTPDIYLMDDDGSNIKRLTNNEYIKSDISWSPDGRYILFVSRHKCWDPINLLNNCSGVMEKRESSEELDPDIYDPEIYIVDTRQDNPEPKQLTHNSVLDETPVWSPDGSKIAFVSYLDGDAEIFTMSSNGGNQQRLTNNTYEDINPSW